MTSTEGIFLGMLIGYILGALAILFVAYLGDKLFGNGVIIFEIEEDEDADGQPVTEST